jgi:hypothetical protein
MDDVRAEMGERFAWCFSHGRLHRFTAKPWCTATWVGLRSITEAGATAEKLAQFGEAQFFHHLPPEEQALVLGTQED